MTTDDVDDEGFGDFIFAPPPPPLPLILTTVARPESSGVAAMSPNFVEDDDWGDFINSSGGGGGGGGFSGAGSLPFSSDLFGIPVAGKQDEARQTVDRPMKASGAFPLSLFGEVEDEGEEGREGDSGGGFPAVKNPDPVKKTVDIDVKDVIADLYKTNGDVKSDRNGLENGSGPRDGGNENGLDADWSWGRASGLIANGTSELKSDSGPPSLDFDPLNSNSNGWNLNGNLSSVVPQGSNLSSNGSNVANSSLANGIEGLNDEEDDDGWEFKAAESNVEEIVKPEQMKNLNGLMISNPIELNSSWNGGNLGFSGWSMSANGFNQSSNWLKNDPVIETKEPSVGDAWGFVVAGSNSAPDEKIKNIDNISEDASKTNFNNSSLSWDLVQLPDSNGLPSSLSGVNSDVRQVNPGFLDEDDEFGDADGWAFKKAESDLQDAQVKMENGLKIQSSVSDSNLNMFSLGGGGGMKLDLFAADWDKREVSSDIRQLNPKLSSETEDPDGDDDWEFKIAESESKPIDSSSKDNNLRHSHSTGVLPLSLFGEEEKDANDFMFQEVSSAQISAPETKSDNRGLSSSLSINDLISSLYNEVGPTAPASRSLNQGENGLGPAETALASTASNDQVFDDSSWEFKDASSVPIAEEQTFNTEDTTTWCNDTELPDWVDLFTELKEELCLIAYQHLENMKGARETAALMGDDAGVSVLVDEIQELHSGLSKCSNIAEEVHPEDQLPHNSRLAKLFEMLQQPKFQVIESEYQLSEKLSLVKNDSKSTLQLLEKVLSVLRILTLVSRQEQTSYVSTWSKMLTLCVEELRHASMIWNQLLQENLRDEVLSMVEGKRYILALGEVYRVVEVLHCSARLYKPWMLIGPDSMGFDAVMSECSTLWSSSGLEEALLSIADVSSDCGYDGSVETLLDSITYLRNLEDATLYEIVFSCQGPICQLSALNPGVVPGMKLVVQNDGHCFAKLANIWTNLTKSGLPSLPQLLVE